MASKLTKLRWPSFRVYKGASYTQFLKAVFEYNYQRKDLMDKGLVDGQWQRMVIRDVPDSKAREGLMQLVNKKDARMAWKNKYTPEKYYIISGPRIEGTRPVPINDRIVNVPITSKGAVERIDYIHFSSTALPRANPTVKLGRETTDEAWRAFVNYVFENWRMNNPKFQANRLLAQSRSHAADQYWADREAEQEAIEQEEDEDP